MVVAIPAPVSDPINGHDFHANGNGNGNGTVVPFDAKFEPKKYLPSLPPAQLVDSDTVAMLAKRFNLDGFVNYHEYHSRECSKIEIDSVEVRDNTFIEKMVQLEVKQTSHWQEVMMSRKSINNHLQHVIEDSDKLLEGLIILVQKLEHAEHNMEVAKGKLKASKDRRAELEDELADAKCALEAARVQVMNVLAERDAQIVKTQTAENLAEMQKVTLDHFKNDVKRLEDLVKSLALQRAAAVETARKAVKDEAQARTDLAVARAHEKAITEDFESLRVRFQILEKQYEASQKKNMDLEIKFQESSNKLDLLIAQYDHLKVELESTTKINEDLKAENDGFEVRIQEVQASADQAKGRATKAEEDRDEAEKAYRDAHRKEKELHRRLSKVKMEWEHSQSELKEEQMKNQSLRIEREHVLKMAHYNSHWTKETIEWGQALNFMNHRLLQEWRTMQDEKKKALEKLLDTERKSLIFVDDSTHVRARILGLEAELKSLNEASRAAEIDQQALARQWEERKKTLTDEVELKTKQLDDSNIIRMGLEKELTAERTDNRETKEKLEVANAQIDDIKEECKNTVAAKDKEHADKLKDMEEKVQKRVIDEVDVTLARASHRPYVYTNVTLLEIFYGGKRVDDVAVYKHIGEHWGSTEPLALSKIFGDKDKKQTVIVYRTKSSDEPAIYIASAQEGALKLPALKGLKH
ncbi:hypothetical protein N7456_006471 [Penicillium angulare]|uniref:Uncharacterized protein n=1 Tax=Penicillium angulare TaxID=116970 RepID=A0A9W9FHV1_9EURO|nr:hypothetical protein N7456_006471 [Penicillium angulare]